MRADVLAGILEANGVPVKSSEEPCEDDSCGYVHIEGNYQVILDGKFNHLIYREPCSGGAFLPYSKSDYLVTVEGYISTYVLATVIREAYFDSKAA